MRIARQISSLAVIASLVLAQPVSHTVQKGDTLYSLARRYGTTVETLKPYFAPFGEAVDEIIVALDEEGKARGFAIVLFRDPQLGQLAIDAVNARDYPLVQGIVVVVAALVVLVTVVVDLLVALLDPRIRF